MPRSRACKTPGRRQPIEVPGYEGTGVRGYVLPRLHDSLADELGSCCFFGTLILFIFPQPRFPPNTNTIRRASCHHLTTDLIFAFIYQHRLGSRPKLVLSRPNLSLSINPSRTYLGTPGKTSCSCTSLRLPWLNTFGRIAPTDSIRRQSTIKRFAAKAWAQHLFLASDNTAKLSPLIIPRTISYAASTNQPPPRRTAFGDTSMNDGKKGRRRRSSSLLYQEPPESMEHMSDQSALPNLNADWVNAKGESEGYSYEIRPDHGRTETLEVPIQQTRQDGANPGVSK